MNNATLNTASPNPPATRETSKAVALEASALQAVQAEKNNALAASIERAPSRVVSSAAGMHPRVIPRVNTVAISPPADSDRS